MACVSVITCWKTADGAVWELPGNAGCWEAPGGGTATIRQCVEATP